MCSATIPSCRGPRASDASPPKQITVLGQAARILRRLRQLPPLDLRCVRCKSRACDVERRQVDGVPRQAPRGEGKVERGDLGAARVDLQPEEVVPQHGADGLLDREPLFGHSQPHEELERFDKKVAAAATRIEHPQRRGFTGPIGKGPGSGTPRARALVPLVLDADAAHEAQAGEVVAALRLQAHRPPQFLLVGGGPRHVPGYRPVSCPRKPRPDGVVQEEEDHVVLGEQLRDCG